MIIGNPSTLALSAAGGARANTRLAGEAASPRPPAKRGTARIEMNQTAGRWMCIEIRDPLLLLRRRFPGRRPQCFTARDIVVDVVDNLSLHQGAQVIAAER